MALHRAAFSGSTSLIATFSSFTYFRRLCCRQLLFRRVLAYSSVWKYSDTTDTDRNRLYTDSISSVIQQGTVDRGTNTADVSRRTNRRRRREKTRQLQVMRTSEMRKQLLRYTNWSYNSRQFRPPCICPSNLESAWSRRVRWTASDRHASQHKARSLEVKYV